MKKQKKNKNAKKLVEKRARALQVCRGAIKSWRATRVQSIDRVTVGARRGSLIETHTASSCLIVLKRLISCCSPSNNNKLR